MKPCRGVSANATDTTGVTHTVATFATGFDASYAVVFDGTGTTSSYFGNVILFSLGTGGSINYVTSAFVATAGDYTLTVPASDIGLGAPGANSFNLEGTLIADAAYRSNETIGDECHGAGHGGRHAQRGVCRHDHVLDVGHFRVRRGPRAQHDRFCRAGRHGARGFWLAAYAPPGVRVERRTVSMDRRPDRSANRSTSTRASDSSGACFVWRRGSEKASGRHIRCLQCVSRLRRWEEGNAERRSRWTVNLMIDIILAMKQRAKWADCLQSARLRRQQEYQKPRSPSRCATTRGFGPKCASRLNVSRRRPGYRPNALVANLFAHLRASKTSIYQSTLGLLCVAKDPSELTTVPTFRAWIEGCHARATELGYGFDQLWIHEPGVTPAPAGENSRRPQHPRRGRRRLLRRGSHRPGVRSYLEPLRRSGAWHPAPLAGHSFCLQ